MRFHKPYHGLIAALLFAGVLLGCRERAMVSSTVPEEIVGIWTTQNKESAGVSIEFTAKSIIISSDLGVAENAVVKVMSQKGPADESVVYSIYYFHQDKKTSLMEVVYFPEQEGTIRFRSEPSMVWKRSK